MTDTESPWVTSGRGGLSDRVKSRLERTARDVAADWGLRLGPPFRLARYSFAAPAGDDAVLKVLPAEDDEADHEADGLAFWGGHGAVRLLRHDRGRRAVLIQRAVPGTDAAGLTDEEATRVGVEVGRLLWRRAERGRPFRWIGDHVPRWLAGAPDHAIVRAARQVYASMTVGDATLVHGDFHHHNLLRHGDRWLAIDPKPYVGDAEYDVAPFLWNPIGSLVTRERTERRIAAFAAAGLDPERIRKWTIVRGAYLAFPLAKHETEDTSPQLRTVRLVL
jgi:streptomycin 6-kinase